MNTLARRPGRPFSSYRFSFVLATIGAVGLLVGGLLAPPAAVASGSDSWTGAGDGSSWTDGNNWSGGVPQNGDSVAVAPTVLQTSPQVTGVPGSTSLQDLSMTNASLSGGAVTVNGDFTWSVSQGQNVIDAPLTVEGSATISGAGKKITMDQMTFDGSTEVSGTGLLETEFSGAITNTGRFQLEPGSAVEANACCANPNKFVSTGILAMPASSSGTATLGFMGLSIAGPVVVGAGSALDVVSGPAAFSPGIAIDGGGTLTFDQGETVKLAAGVTIHRNTTVELTGNADFTGTGGFAGSGSFLWTGGHIEGNLATGPSVATTISGTGTKDLSSVDGKPITLTLGGTTKVSGTGPVHLGSAATLDNRGMLTANPGTTFEAGVCCASPDHFTNDGTLTVAAGTQPTSFAYLAFLNHGTVKLASGKLVVGELSYTQTSGVTSLEGGSISSTLPVLIKGGTLTGSGTVGAALVNGGTVKPSTTAGVLSVNGSYQQTKSGTFATVVTGPSPGHQFGQLVVNGPSKLAGAIKVTTSHFTPKKKQSFQVMRYRSHTGSFTSRSGMPKYSISYTGSVHIRY
jgi:fibronectin-binding autotransporter adhesin